MVFGVVCGMSLPAALERAASSAPSGSAPKTRIDELMPRAATQHPARSPPPPTGVTIASRWGTSPSSSSAAVFERADLLQVLAREVNLPAGEAIERRRGHDRRTVDDPADARGGFANGSKIDGVSGHEGFSIARTRCAIRALSVSEGSVGK